MAFTHRFSVRFEDVDYARVVYYPRLFGYCHNAFEEFFAQEGGVTYAELLTRRGVGFPTVHCEADFKAPLRFGDSVRVVMEAVGVSQRSITCRYRFYVNDRPELCAELKVVTAAIDMQTFRPTELPEELKALFGRHAAD
jgi:4-hydroxybenzoyl-CoA thioesterase